MIEANYLFGAEILLMQADVAVFKKNNPGSAKADEAINRIERLMAYKQAWDEQIELFTTVNALHSKQIAATNKVTEDYRMLLETTQL